MDAMGSRRFDSGYRGQHGLQGRCRIEGGVNMNRKETRALAALEFLTGLGIILFWIGFFTVWLAPENPPQCYHAFEHSFPLPDTILALALIGAAFLLMKGNPRGRDLSLVCGGGLTFLGVLDFSFNIQNGMYAISVLDTVLNASINVWCTAFGLFIAFRMAGTRPGIGS